jgi:hypothetical protein
LIHPRHFPRCNGIGRGLRQRATVKQAGAGSFDRAGFSGL